MKKGKCLSDRMILSIALTAMVVTGCMTLGISVTSAGDVIHLKNVPYVVQKERLD